MNTRSRLSTKPYDKSQKAGHDQQSSKPDRFRAVRKQTIFDAVDGRLSRDNRGRLRELVGGASDRADRHRAIADPTEALADRLAAEARAIPMVSEDIRRILPRNGLLHALHAYTATLFQEDSIVMQGLDESALLTLGFFVSSLCSEHVSKGSFRQHQAIGFVSAKDYEAADGPLVIPSRTLRHAK